MIDLRQWDVRLKRTFVAKRKAGTTNWEQIPKQQVKVNQSSIIVRLSNSNAPNYWYFAGKCTLFAVDSQNNQIRLNSTRINLKELTYLEANKSANSYLIEFWFPWWHDKMLVEIWESTEVEEDCNICDKLDQIQRSIADADYD